MIREVFGSVWGESAVYTFAKNNDLELVAIRRTTFTIEGYYRPMPYMVEQYGYRRIQRIPKDII